MQNRQLAPGAQNMIKYMDQTKLDILEKSPLHLVVPEWAVIMDAFHSWPFHPEVSRDFRSQKKHIDKHRVMI
jgi:hypothetical protein